MKILKTLFVLTVAGLLFSGYLSAVKLITKSCAFGETCPLFLGYPACWYGFVMYLVMFIVTLFALTGKIGGRSAFKTDATVSFLGIIFAGNLTVQEFMNGSITGGLGLSTCAYGLIFYVLIFIVSCLALRTVNAKHSQ